MFYTIYKTTNKLNGKIYIGKHQTNDLNDAYLGSGKRLWNSIAKHGIENFEKETLFIFETEDEMNDKEKELVTKEFCLREDTYNLCPGGHGGFGYINENKLQSSKSAREKCVQTRRLNESWVAARKNGIKNFTPEAREKANVTIKQKYPNGTWFGKTHTNETKIKIGQSNSLKQTGAGNSQYGTQWITNGVESLKIKKDEPIPEGWKGGRK